MANRSADPQVSKRPGSAGGERAPRVAKDAGRSGKDGASARARGAPAARAQAPPAAPLSIIKMEVNGDPVTVAAKSNRTLLEVLREELDLVGTKQGCDEGECGACT